MKTFSISLIYFITHGHGLIVQGRYALVSFISASMHSRVDQLVKAKDYKVKDNRYMIDMVCQYY